MGTALVFLAPFIIFVNSVLLQNTLLIRRMISSKTFVALVFSTLIWCSLTGCSKKKGNTSSENNTKTTAQVKSKIGTGNSFNYKVFYQDANTPQTRKGLIILAVGDGGNENNGTLNAQCDALAQKGYVAITTTYRPMPATYVQWYINFKQDIEQIIGKETAAYGIARNKVVIGGLSRGGNLTLGLVLPAQMDADHPPITGIKGVILECAGGDNWKGTAILFPVLFMSNATDKQVGTNADAFKTGLQSNGNLGVKDKSQLLVIPGEGHCTGSSQYKDFITQHIDSWF